MTKHNPRNTTPETNIPGLTPGNYPASPLGPLIAELKTGGKKAYRELFDEIEQQGKVPHDRSIVGPAAYLADMLRMVTTKEAENAKLPDIRKLKSRRLIFGTSRLMTKTCKTRRPIFRLPTRPLRGTSLTLQRRRLAGKDKLPLITATLAVLIPA